MLTGCLTTLNPMSHQMRNGSLLGVRLCVLSITLLITLPPLTLWSLLGARAASIYVYGTKKIYMHFVQKQTLCFCHFKRTQERIFAA